MNCIPGLSSPACAIEAAETSLVHVCITGKEGVLSERPIHVINQ